MCAFSTAAQRVIESESTVTIREQAIEVTLTIETKTVAASANVDLAIVDAAGVQRATLTQSARLSAGKRNYKFAISLANPEKYSDEIAWWRLSYSIDGITGIASLSELLASDFVLRASSFQRLEPGKPFRVRIRSLSPFSERAVKNVSITAELNLSLDVDTDDDELKIKRTARTDADGFATIDFPIPSVIKLDDDPEIVLTGRKNGIVRTIEEDLDDDDYREGSVFLTADKPLYQPGQAFNLRGLYLAPDNTVVADEEIEFSIEDEDSTVIYRETVKTSAFGIASITWSIPENTKLGMYRVAVDTDSDIRDEPLSFKVTRYDLPNFTVAAKPDKSFYLPTDKEASINISADYLFGKPVPDGKVRVVQEAKRKWNYSEQKYEIDEGATSEGTADKSGKFAAKFDLTRELAQLMQSSWIRYQDISYAAYYTDPSTNRTEQRRFDIRLSKEPIHIYFIQWNTNHPDLRTPGYVSTFYADGTPAVCNVEVRDDALMRARFKTNSLAAGKFEIDIPRDKVKREQYEIKITARDSKGNIGTFEGSFNTSDTDALQITTDKTIYKPGEVIELDLRSTKQRGFVYLDLLKDWSPVDSHVVELRGGKAHLSIPYKPDFKSNIVIAAYTDLSVDRWDDKMRAVRGVIFPEQQNLIIDAKFTKKEYRPDEEAAVRFSVLDGSRKPRESAIGLGIFDKAIEERARTESEFGLRYFGQFYRLMGYDRSMGNISLKDLNDLDMTRSIDPDLQLVAEIILAGNWYYPHVYHSSNFNRHAGSAYREAIKGQLSPAIDALKEQFGKDFDSPSDQSSLERILVARGINFSSLKDPWGQGYHTVFSVRASLSIVEILSTGPDKVLGNDDDVSAGSASFAYFTKAGRAIDRAVVAYHDRTGGFIRDLETLSAELRREGIEVSQLRDLRGRPYEFGFAVEGRYYAITVRSLGDDGIPDIDQQRDDFDIWKTFKDYFSGAETAINRALDAEINQAKKPFPQSEAAFIDALRRGGLDISFIEDGYGRPVEVKGSIARRYADNTKIENGKTTITPVTQEIVTFSLLSKGADLSSAVDDRSLATFSAAITEAHKGTGFESFAIKTSVFSGSRGAISGIVLDANGAVIPGAEVTAKDEVDETLTYRALTNDDGTFLFANIPSGRYTVRVQAPNFQAAVHTSVSVPSQTQISMTVTLQVGSVSATVAVTAAAETDQTMSATSSNIRSSSITGFKVDIASKTQTSTPRLREYFPESLVWQPELLTDKKGKAELKFKMADNITTWKMFAIASDRKGKVGVIEKEVTAFQPFFADLDPPQFLTEGDEIHLPTQVRNYTERKQKVDVSMDKADWFSFLNGDSKQSVDVAAGGSTNAVFGFKAIAPVKGGKQRVTAIAQSESDAIEKPVTVRPDGEEIVRTESRLFNSTTKFEIDFPANALEKTQRAELKIYPNLFSHVAESVEGLLERPYGCGEQTISSTYPNVMILKFIKNDPELLKKAENYLQKGYERLIGYQIADGGFTYWGGRDTSDIALTAYAIRFLSDADEFIDVDSQVLRRAESWLISQQRADGSWTKRYNWEKADDQGRTKMLTTYVTRSLAMRPSSFKGSLEKALAYLKQRNSEIDEPYSLALFGLASLDAGDTATAKQIATQLEKMAIAEGDGAYWKLETNTPFYGWGTAGRIETTALVVQLLSRVAKLDSKANDETISRGSLFLLKNKDRYGVWYSTQTTINVLDAFLAILASADPAAQQQTLQLAINGVSLPDVSVEPDRVHPITLDLADKIAPTANKIEIRSDSNSPVMAQLVATHYVDWRDSQSTKQISSGNRALRLDYKCDRRDAAIMQEVSCSVDAERIGFRGYGMLLAEIGTPPGADVSRESLEAALQSNVGLSRYDILPDRIVLYMWARAGGTKFNFKFRPRYAINAQTPASIVYDYYNPEAQATVVPLRFEVK